ncbi:MAG TPA: TldD/PmbA family protein [Anaerolineae bacterium]|nr:TldD/PmbA family protein [Anaerolineae bacterium]
MLGSDRIRQITQRVLAHSNGAQTEIVVLGEESALTRFANSRIHQNVAERNVQVRVRAVAGRRVGVAVINDLSDAALQQVAENALEIAALQPENPDFHSLPAPRPVSEVGSFVRATAECTPEQRAKAVSTICRLATENGLVASGAFTTQSSEIAVTNSLGTFAYAPATYSDLSTVIMSDDSSGYAGMTSTDVHDIDAERAGREAVDKALRSRNPQPVEPGEYTVILEEYAVAELLSYLSYLGLGALSVQEGRSFMANKFGQRITGENISIWDEGLDRTGLPTPFDFEGVPKQRVDLITDGVAKAVVYDSYCAGKEGTESTGHALPAPNHYGPLPGNLFMKAGQHSLEQMPAKVERGVWITRFHYVNPVHPLKTILTGMTRDGTFLIEDGEIKEGVKNLRFTQNILEALSAVDMIGAETKLRPGFFGGNRVPALLIRRFSFTSATEF